MQQQSTISKNSFAWKRVQKDQEEIYEDLPESISLNWPDPNNIMVFEIIVSPDENLWKGGRFPFTVSVGENYPINAPKVLCKKKILHPNIDLDGKVCLNVLREDWSPVCTLKDIVFGLLLLFVTPNPHDPLNKDAAQLMMDDKENFKKQVMQSMRGYSINGVKYDRII